MCIVVFCQHTVCVRCSRRAEEGTGSPGSGVSDGCELPWCCWEPNLGLLKGQQVFLAMEPPLHANHEAFERRVWEISTEPALRWFTVKVSTSTPSSQACPRRQTVLPRANEVQTSSSAQHWKQLKGDGQASRHGDRKKERRHPQPDVILATWGAFGTPQPSLP